MINYTFTGQLFKKCKKYILFVTGLIYKVAIFPLMYL